MRGEVSPMTGTVLFEPNPPVSTDINRSPHPHGALVDGQGVAGAGGGDQAVVAGQEFGRGVANFERGGLGRVGSEQVGGALGKTIHRPADGDAAGLPAAPTGVLHGGQGGGGKYFEHTMARMIIYRTRAGQAGKENRVLPFVAGNIHRFRR